MTSRDKLAAPVQLGPDITTDTSSPSFNQRGAEGTRLIIRETAGGTADVQPEGSADNVNWYPMGTLKSLGANEVFTRWIGEPNAYVRVTVSASAGSTIVIETQRFGA